MEVDSVERLIIMSSFGDYVKQIRESKGLTLNQTAMYSGISAAQLSRIENGKRGTPKPPTIKALSEALKIDYDELMKVAGYIDQPVSNNESETDSIDEEVRKLIEDPEFMVAYKEMPGSPEEIREDLKAFMRMYIEREQRKKNKE